MGSTQSPMASPPTTPKLLHSDELVLDKTSVILTNLNKDDFVSSGKSVLSLVDSLKLQVLNYDNECFLNKIEHWSNLPFLRRVIIILSDNETTLKLHNFLISESVVSDKLRTKDLKISLRENLISRSRSFESLSAPDFQEELKKFQAEKSSQEPKKLKRTNSMDSYEEPKPAKFDDDDLFHIGITPQIITPQPLGRERSLTKTLFKPELSLNTKLTASVDDVPQSPTITLDESY